MGIQQIIEVKSQQYFLHQVDRWFNNAEEYGSNQIHMGSYGQGKYIYIETSTGIIIKLNNKEPSEELFMEVLGNEWDQTYKELWKSDNDRTDYVPYYYKTIAKYLADEPTMHNKYTSD
jgi:hypothetical protein